MIGSIAERRQISDNLYKMEDWDNLSDIQKETVISGILTYSTDEFIERILDGKYSKVYYVLSTPFIFANTKEGLQFWGSIRDRLV